MKAIWIFLLCLPAMFFMSCDEGFYDEYSSNITIENKLFKRENISSFVLEITDELFE